MSAPNVCPQCQKPSHRLLSDPVLQIHALTPIAEIGKNSVKLAALRPSRPEAYHTFNFVIPGILSALAILAFPTIADMLLPGANSGPTDKIAESLLAMARSGIFLYFFYAHAGLIAAMAIFKHFSNIRIDKDNARSALHKPELDKLRHHAGQFCACLSCKTLWNANEKILKPFQMTNDSLRAAVSGGEQLAAFEAREIIAEISAAADPKQDIEPELLSCIRPTSTSHRL